jgi:hypothetical protein
VKQPIPVDDTVGRLDVLLLRFAEALTREFIRQNQQSIVKLEKLLKPVVSAVQVAAEMEQDKRRARRAR